MAVSDARNPKKKSFRPSEVTAIRGPMLTFRTDPWMVSESESVDYESDALVVMENGLIREVGPADRMLPQLEPGVEVTRWKDHLILPGFIDCHTHFPQTDMIAARGNDLLDWLNRYTFVEEQGFSAPAHAREVASFFLDEQLRHGVTTSSVFCTTAPESVEALLTEAHRRHLRIMAGKVCMDRNAPEALLDSPGRAFAETCKLLHRWKGQGRVEVVITPRFAPTSSEYQLAALGAFAKEFPDSPIQSHISEQKAEISWVKRLFPKDADYTAVYARHGLLKKRSIFGHGIHLSESELRRFSESGASIAHCPTSNFFLGSGCLKVSRLKKSTRPVKVGLATDVGAGTGFSMLQTMNEAYKAAKMKGTSPTAFQLLYLATRGSAEALGLENRIGAIAPGMEADLVVLDPRATPLAARRMKHAESLHDQLFALLTLGDDRHIAATYIAGIRWNMGAARPSGA
ncbi:MAG: guanine deaminase [Verrucomicrobia bacterium]|nr:guanine deaminase [Verrucomicrobiota bacterium]MCH8510423.1 guanine deaminase [Kiritimatiellia bacterium]